MPELQSPCIDLKIPSPAALSQQGRLSFLFKDSVLYGGAAAVSKSFALITFPLLARHFSVAEYGVIDFFIVLSGLLVTLFVFGQDSAVARFFYEVDDSHERRQIISQSLFIQILSLMLFLPPIWWAAVWLDEFFIEIDDAKWLFRIVLLQVPFLLLINFSQNLLKWTFARVQFLIMSLGYTIVQTGLLLVAVLVLEVSVQGVLFVSLCTSLLFGVVGLYLVRRWLALPSDLHHLKEILPFAIPYGVICVVAAFSPAIERILIDHFLNADALGLYAAGTKIAMLVGLIVGAFQTAWGPFSLSLFKHTEAAETFNWVLKIFSLGICVLALVLTLIAEPLLVFLVSDRYSGAAVIVFPLAVGLAFQATGWITEIGIGIAKRSHLNLYAYGASIVVTLGGILLLAPMLGLLGVGLGVMSGHVVRACVSSWLAQRAYPIPWHYGPVLSLFGLTLLFGFVSISARRSWGGQEQSLILVIGVLFTGIFGWRLLFTSLQRKHLLELLNTYQQRLYPFSIKKTRRR
jgi:O-antigen/teichoic acid export membrane protein